VSAVAQPPRRAPLILPGGITLDARWHGPQPKAAARRVMFLHGFPESGFVWDEVCAMLVAARGDLAMLAPTLRGYAGSSAPAGVAAYRARELVGDLVAAIEAVGAPLDLLVAHDWGGALAWALAAQHPALLRRLLVLNAPHPATFQRELRDNPAQQAASAYMNFLCRSDAAALLAENDWARLWRLFGPTPPGWLTPALSERLRASWAGGLEGPLNYYRASPLRPATGSGDALGGLVLPDAATRVTVPTTVLWGELDAALRPSLLDGLDRWVPQLQVHVVPDASHWIVHEQPQRVVREVLALL
jgi:pimeloyl-ACP methyl ester carboxylesterase